MLDIVIIGAGPAGMTAAIYGRRKGLSLAVISDSAGGQMRRSANIENYPGFDAITGSELADKMKEQLKHLDLEITTDRVNNVEKITGGFASKTEGGKRFESRSVIVAAGAHWRELEVQGEKEYLNKGISFCSTCDGPLYAGMDVAVVGGGNCAAESVIDLIRIANKVYMIVRHQLKADKMITDQIRSNPKVTVFENHTVSLINGKDFVESIEIKSKSGETKTLAVGGVFVEIGHDPNTTFIKNLVRINNHGEIIIDGLCNTNVPGIFACGDITDVPQKQAIVAAGEGAKAAMSAYTYLTRTKK